MNNNNMENWAVSAMCQKLYMSPISYQFNTWLNIIIVKKYLSGFIITFMSTFQYA